MAGSGRASIEGGPELSRAFRRMADRVDDFDPVHRDAAEIVEARALELVPFVSGTLRESIRIEPTALGSTVLAGGFGVPYAEVIHFGWPARNIEPQPYLYDALDDRRAAVIERYADQVDAEVRRFDREAP